MVANCSPRLKVNERSQPLVALPVHGGRGWGWEALSGSRELNQQPNIHKIQTKAERQSGLVFIYLPLCPAAKSKEFTAHINHTPKFNHTQLERQATAMRENKYFNCYPFLWSKESYLLHLILLQHVAYTRELLEDDVNEYID